MKRKLISAAIVAALAFPTFALAQGRRGNGGNGTQQRSRIHTPGTCQQTGTAVQQQKRDRKRDGTGPNCTGNCLQQQNQTQTTTQQQTQTQQQTRQQTQNPK